jgi:hypothetical protein
MNSSGASPSLRAAGAVLLKRWICGSGRRVSEFLNPVITGIADVDVLAARIQGHARGKAGPAWPYRRRYLLPLNKSLCIRPFKRLTHSLAASSGVLTQKPEMSEPPLYS